MAQSLFAVTIVVPDYDAAIDFYVNVLGFGLIEDTRQTPTKRWVMVAPKEGTGCRLLLAKADGEKQRSAIGNQTGGRVGFFLSTTDFHADYALYRQRGVVFEEEPRHEPYGWVVVFNDPFGNRWDLLERSA